jgi:hypothetical protein
MNLPAIHLSLLETVEASFSDPVKGGAISKTNIFATILPYGDTTMCHYLGLKNTALILRYCYLDLYQWDRRDPAD